MLHLHQHLGSPSSELQVLFLVMLPTVNNTLGEEEVQPCLPLCCSVDISIQISALLGRPQQCGLAVLEQRYLRVREGLLSPGSSCAWEEDLGGWLSNTEALSVFGDTQSSLKGESNPID